MLFRSIDVLPTDVQRTMIHLNRVRRDQIFTYPKLPDHPDWIATWSDFVGQVPDLPRAAEFHAADRSVVVLKNPGLPH